jgi:hypothetical protein
VSSIECLLAIDIEIFRSAFVVGLFELEHFEILFFGGV